ncbi:MAG: hypothetical protein DRN24_07065, partial [Thermoplasmata archaeon]
MVDPLKYQKFVLGSSSERQQIMHETYQEMQKQKHKPVGRPQTGYRSSKPAGGTSSKTGSSKTDPLKYQKFVLGSSSERQQIMHETYQEMQKQKQNQKHAREKTEKTRYTPQEWMQQTYEWTQKVNQQIQQVQQLYNVEKTRRFNPFQRYIVKTNGRETTVSGVQAMMMHYSYLQNLKKTEERLQDISFQTQKLYHQASFGVIEWHPETRIVKTQRGYEFRFPYTGAEHYRSTRRRIEQMNPLERFALALTPSNFAGIPATVEYLLGRKQKAYDIEVRSIWETKRNSFPVFYLSSPMGVIGTTAIGGTAIGAGGKLVSGFALAKWGTRGLSIARGAGAVVGAGLIGMSTVPVVKDIQKGEFGSAAGKGFALGIGIASGYAGYKSVSSSIASRLTNIGYRLGSKIKVPL